MAFCLLYLLSPFYPCSVLGNNDIHMTYTTIHMTYTNVCYDFLRIALRKLHIYAFASGVIRLIVITTSTLEIGWSLNDHHPARPNHFRREYVS
ncbi:hypothetical protein AVEN_195562-1 [Araneus ventricosus]|uniref:Secreted protein n=1 Tax=Araneus ventricosus TaxID=182803 RepID=A0A4Y2ETS8_ARAVE|nr:hypothetical protein AVEN_195562-1 [Araneus ventricosus]